MYVRRRAETYWLSKCKADPVNLDLLGNSSKMNQMSKKCGENGNAWVSLNYRKPPFEVTGRGLPRANFCGFVGNMTIMSPQPTASAKWVHVSPNHGDNPKKGRYFYGIFLEYWCYGIVCSYICDILNDYYCLTRVNNVAIQSSE